MNTLVWTSNAFQINADTCVDVKADDQVVVLGQLGAVWLHNLHLTPSEADDIGDALKIAASKSREAGARP